MSSPIESLHDYPPQSPFLRDVIDVAATPVTEKTTGKTLPGNQIEPQRRHYIRMTSELLCLRGHGIVNRILGELEAAKTNRDYIEALKRIELIVFRVRKKLTEAQILVWSGDAFGLLQLRQDTPTQEVPFFQVEGAKTRIREGMMAIDFLNNLLPLLAQKGDEIQRRAYEVGEPVFRDEREFSADFYGSEQAAESSETSSERRIWNGVQLPNRSEYGPKLLRLSMQAEYVDRVITFEELVKLLSDSETPINILALKQGLIKLDNLFKTAGKPTPYQKIHGQGVLFHSSSPSGGQPAALAAPEEGGFTPNADFLDQPLMFQPEESTGPAVENLTSDTVDTLGLSDDAEALLAYLMKHEGATKRVSDAVTTTGKKEISLSTAALVAEINEKLAHTGKKVTFQGHMLRFADKE